MTSIWSISSQTNQRKSLNGSIKTNTAIIGGGLAGILISYELTKRGIDNIILEANTIGSGQTKNTTAKITSQHNIIYSKLIDKMGVSKAKQYALANELAISQYEKIIQEHNIGCDFERTNAYLYSMDTPEKLYREAEYAKQLGISASFLEDIFLPFNAKGILVFRNQAQFQPLEFLYRIAQGLNIYEHTPVTRIEGDNVLICKDGTVSAQNIVFATHYPFVNVPGYYFMRMYQKRSYVIALKNAEFPDGMYLGTDGDSLSFRKYKDMLIMGGGSHRTGENESGGKYDMLRRYAKKLFPDSEEVCSWSAQDTITLDSVPYIGKFSASKDNWFVATGFGKWGMTSSMVSSMIIPDLILNNDSPYAEVFSPQRVVINKNVADMMVQSIKGLSKQLFTLPDESVKNIENGDVGIVEYNGEKVGVYKDYDGKIFPVNIRCPHLGCELTWNKDEKSWDCPCHGSRFDYMGNIIDNPAQEDISIYEQA